ncbi:MAG: diaminopimelate epimerase [Xanthomonadales bacterium]|nr:diaminopimelate epimerase [Xanthomonadales bacterium]
MALAFSKMHGLGNDFVIVDCRARAWPLDAVGMRAMGDRRRGVGFDQLLTIEVASDPSCAFAYRIWNRDGTPAGQCGNGLRCVARWLQREGSLASGTARLQGPAGPVEVTLLESGEVRADMGEPRFQPADVPLRAAGVADAYPVALAATEPEAPARETQPMRLAVGAVSMGNPHAVLEVEDVATAPVTVLGPRLERSPDFPEGCNVGFAAVASRGRIGLRVWERGAGETPACGSGAAAAVAVLRRRGALDREVEVRLPGGSLRIDWPGPGHPLQMTGPASFVFEGRWPLPQQGGG